MSTNPESSKKGSPSEEAVAQQCEKVYHLILCLRSGILIEDLDKDDKLLLKKIYGKNFCTKLDKNNPANKLRDLDYLTTKTREEHPPDAK